eukprot:494630-Prymnesium_polylepis.1
MAGQKGRDQVRDCLRQGGMAVAFRTGPQFEAHSKIMAEINDSRGADEKAYGFTLLLDEADKFLGDPTAYHSQQLQWMLGFKSRAQPNVPLILACVSATNMGPNYWVFRRMHTSKDRRLCMSFADQVTSIPYPTLPHITFLTLPHLTSTM